MSGDPQTHEIIGAAMEVHRELGHGFLEAVYQAALACEFESRGIEHETERVLRIRYKNDVLAPVYKADFVCFGEIIIELKALGQMGGNEEAQLLNYLKATGFHRGLLLNFGAPSLQMKRMVHGFHLAS